ncbi:MAG: response regulator [Proteobacteria bacterium]|nr:response regulator [Pseudomonadota bacterium]
MASKLIMIVEDSPTDRKIAEDVCSGNGFRVITVTEGDKVLATAIEKMPDLILLDVILPNKNGFQVCRQLKSNNATKDIKVVIVSSKDQASDKFWGMKQGADDYITKPYSEDDLIDAILKNI